jgi:prolyl-tRNA editing enzyme YbaK/EbsC (Cys-tRNA(Pro) deacylase)
MTDRIGQSDREEQRELPAAARRVARAAAELGLAIEVVEMPDQTRTAEEAARACGCHVAQIVKSLVFRGTETKRPYLLLVSGVNRVDAERAAAAVGEPLDRPDAAFVREVTGFAIGGIPPFGHASAMAVFVDPDLLVHDVVWAAAGTPRTVFSVAPRHLAEAVDATVAPLAG